MNDVRRSGWEWFRAGFYGTFGALLALLLVSLIPGLVFLVLALFGAFSSSVFLSEFDPVAAILSVVVVVTVCGLGYVAFSKWYESAQARREQD